MRFRAISAGLLTVMLLSFSLAASACEIQCDLQTAVAAGPGCHGNSGSADSQQKQPMSSMAGMDRSAMWESAIQTKMAFQSHSCTHSVCVQQPALVSSENVAMIHAPASLQAIAAAAPMIVSIASSRRNLPHLESSSPVALRTILRV